MDFKRQLIVIISQNSEKLRKAELLFKKSIMKSKTDINTRRTEIEGMLNKARSISDLVAINSAELEKAELLDMCIAGIPIVIYPHAVSVVEPGPCSMEWECKDLSKGFGSAVVTFTIGRLGLSEVFIAYFAYCGELLAYCFRVNDERYQGKKVIVPNLAEVCEVFSFQTSAEELAVLWKTVDIMPLAKRIGDELGIDIHNENMTEFLSNKCMILEDLGIGKVYNYLG